MTTINEFYGLLTLSILISQPSGRGAGVVTGEVGLGVNVSQKFYVPLKRQGS